MDLVHLILGCVFVRIESYCFHIVCHLLLTRTLVLVALKLLWLIMLTRAAPVLRCDVYTVPVV